MANVAKLREVLDYIKTHPQQWQQSVWFINYTDGNPSFSNEVVEVEEVNSCGSAFCFAGHAALMNGFPAPPKNNGDPWAHEIDGQFMYVEQFARDVLELTYGQGTVMFDAGNSMEDLEWMIGEIEKNPNVSGDYLTVNAPSYTRYDGCDCDDCMRYCNDDDEDDEYY